jgi:hypothetical protein
MPAKHAKPCEPPAPPTPTVSSRQPSSGSPPLCRSRTHHHRNQPHQRPDLAAVTYQGAKQYFCTHHKRVTCGGDVPQSADMAATRSEIPAGGLLTVIVLMAAGYLVWTLTEYWVHRAVFHLEPRGLRSEASCGLRTGCITPTPMTRSGSSRHHWPAPRSVLPRRPYVG